MLSNDHLVHIEKPGSIGKPDGICSPGFVVDEFLGLFLHTSLFSIKHSRST